MHINRMFEFDFNDKGTRDQPISCEERMFVKKMKEGIHKRNDGHYEPPLPFKEDEPRYQITKNQL